MPAESQSDASATQSEASAKTTSDINTAEAQDASVFDITQGWMSNRKKAYDAYLDLELTRARHAIDHHDHMMSELAKASGELFRRGMTEFSNAMAVSNGENQRTVRHGDVAADRIWNIDEQAAQLKEILTEDQPFKDAISASVVANLAAMAKVAK